MEVEASVNSKYQRINLRSMLIKRKTKIHDIWAIILYAISLVSLVAVCIMKKFNNNPKIENSLTLNNGKVVTLFSLNIFMWIAILLSLFVLMVIFSFWICEHHPKIALYGSFASQVVTFILGGILGGLIGLLVGIFPLAISGIFFFFVILPNMEYVCKMLHFSAHIIKKHVVKLIFVIILQFLCNLLILGAVIYACDEASVSSGIISFCASLMIFWTLNIGTYMVQVIVASIVAYHITAETKEEKESVFSNAIHNTLYSLGSISFGALILAIVQALKATVRRSEERNRERGDDSAGSQILNLIIHILLALFEAIIDYINNLVFPYIAVHNTSYIQSIRESFQAIASEGMKALAAHGGISEVGLLFASLHFLLTLLIYGIYFLVTGTDLVASMEKMERSINLSVILDFFIPSIIFTSLYSTLIGMLSAGVLALIFCKVELQDQLKNNYSEVDNCLDEKSKYLVSKGYETS